MIFNLGSASNLYVRVHSWPSRTEVEIDYGKHTVRGSSSLGGRPCSKLRLQSAMTAAIDALDKELNKCTSTMSQS